MTSPIEKAAGASADDLLAGRPKLLEMADRCRKAVLAPEDAGGLSVSLRAALAARMARLNADEALAADYASDPTGEHAALADPARPLPGEPLLAAIVRHVDLVSTRPREATEADVEALVAAGLPTADVVRLSQLIAFISFEIRTALGLRLLGSAP